MFFVNHLFSERQHRRHRNSSILGDEPQGSHDTDDQLPANAAEALGQNVTENETGERAMVLESILGNEVKDNPNLIGLSPEQRLEKAKELASIALEIEGDLLNDFGADNVAVMKDNTGNVFAIEIRLDTTTGKPIFLVSKIYDPNPNELTGSEQEGFGAKLNHVTGMTVQNTL